MKNLDLYKEIEENLENSRQAILAYNEDPENDEELRSLDQANLILQALKQIAESAFSLFRDYPSLEAVFEKEYGSTRQLSEREAIVETCFLDDFILPDKESLPLIPGQEISSELVDNYVLSFKDWEVVVRNNHLESQELIKENSVAVHVRRGDYIANEDYSKVYHSCGEDYYKSAFNMDQSKVIDLVAFIINCTV